MRLISIVFIIALICKSQSFDYGSGFWGSWGPFGGGGGGGGGGGRFVDGFGGGWGTDGFGGGFRDRFGFVGAPRDGKVK